MLEVLVVMVVVSITSEKVADMDELTATNVPESEGEVEETVGAVVSVVVVSSEEEVVVLSLDVDALSSLLFLAHEMIVRLIRNMNKMMSICLTWFPISV